MAMTNAERQAAWRKRRQAELKRLRREAAKIKRRLKGKTKCPTQLQTITPDCIPPAIKGQQY
jgi:hypothetical protein